MCSAPERASTSILKLSIQKSTRIGAFTTQRQHKYTVINVPTYVWVAHYTTSGRLGERLLSRASSSHSHGGGLPDPQRIAHVLSCIHSGSQNRVGMAEELKYL
jgi:hypothetical protein